MKTIKGLLKKSEDQYETLLEYRSTPLSNGYSPAELLMGAEASNDRSGCTIIAGSTVTVVHISKMQGRHSVKISSVKRKRLINVTEWST